MQKKSRKGEENSALANKIWRLYEQGKSHHSRQNLYERAERCHRFYQGEQWYAQGGGLEEEDLPFYNFIEPVINYKSATIAMNATTIHYVPHLGNNGGEEICRVLGDYATRCWEAQKMDSRLWQVVKEACVTGQSYLYFYDANLGNQLVDGVNIYLADECQPDLQKQRYIILAERQPLSTVRTEAEKNGLSKQDIEAITPDEETTTHSWETAQKTDDEGRCTCLLYMAKTPAGIQFCRATKDMVYLPMSVIPNMKRYPMVSFLWKPKRHTARGMGEVWPLIPNQIEANKTLFRRLQSTKAAAFPKPVYVEGMVENPEDVTTVGSPVRVREGTVQKIEEVFSYLAPASMSGDATLLQNELISQSRALASAGDAALGEVNPERASGAAITAARQAQAVPLNEQAAAFRQMVEDIALVWLDMLSAYYPIGLTEQERRVVSSRQRLNKIAPTVRIELSPTDPYSKYAQEQSLAEALRAGYITFEEYVKLLDPKANSPKAKFEEVLRRRADTKKGAEGQNMEVSQNERL